MEAITQKQAILQSLEAMDPTEMGKVLDYIKDMLYDRAHDVRHQQFRQKAMTEIRKALKKYKRKE